MNRALIALLAAGLRAQSDLPSFDVASLKSVQPSPPYSIDLGNSSHGKLTLTNVTLTECLRFAFKINNDEQFVGPDWMKSHDTLFEIVAKADPETPRDTLRQMTLKLLTERFQLALHHEQRELPYMALTVDKKGSKLHDAAPTADASGAGATVRNGHIIVPRVSIATLIVLIGRFTSRPIVDMTDLKGQYEVKLEWTPVRKDDADAGPTLFEAMQEQLGLKLELRKKPMDVVVIDHAEKTPLGN